VGASFFTTPGTRACPVQPAVSRFPDEIRVGITWCSFLCYRVAMRDFLGKVYDKLYCFLGYADMRFMLGYELGGKRLC